MKNNATLSKDDRFFIFLKDSEETIEYFGKDYLEDYGQQIPDELLNEYKETYKNWQNLQKKLKKYLQY